MSEDVRLIVHAISFQDF